MATKSIEDLTAELEEKENIINDLSGNNKKLTSELRNTRLKIQEVDIELFHKTLEENESLKATNDKLQKQYKTDVEKLSNELSTANNYLERTALDNNLSKALLDGGVDSIYLEDAILHLKQKAKVLRDGDNYKATIEDKTLDEYIPEWVNNYGKKFTKVQPDTGGGAKGGSNQPPKQEDKAMSVSELMQEAFGKK